MNKYGGGPTICRRELNLYDPPAGEKKVRLEAAPVVRGTVVNATPQSTVVEGCAVGVGGSSARGVTVGVRVHGG
eukprot:1230214-Prymnesium_polylepis.1